MVSNGVMDQDFVFGKPARAIYRIAIDQVRWTGRAKE
jgi:ribonucleotide monophosphatase NagD (HAD superfamily)